MSTPAEAAEALEAQIRHAMHEHHAIAPRGFDSMRRRHALHAEIDEMLDLHAQVTAVATLEAAL